MPRIDRVLAALSLDVADPAAKATLPDPIRGFVRARQVEAIARLTPVVMIANILNAVAVVIVFALSGEAMTPILVWAACAAAAAAWFGVSAARKARRAFPATVGAGTVRRLVRNAALMAGLWAWPSVAVLPYAGPIPQAFLIVIAAGMVSGGVTCFYPVPRAAAAYAGVLIVGGIVGAAQADAAMLIGGITVALSYMLVVRRVIARHADIFVSEIAARAELEVKARRIEELMARTRAEADRAVADSLRRLEQAQQMEAVGRLTAGVAHDFNNVLSVIRGNAELQQEQTMKDEMLLAEIVGAADRGAEVVRKLLAFSRMQALRPETLDLADLLRAVETRLRALVGHGVAVRVAAPEGLPRVRVDRGQLTAALDALASNARQAMPDGGTLTISLREQLVAPSEAASLADRSGQEAAPGRYVALAVADDGCGMAPEVRARAFEPFFTTRGGATGGGLGLSMVLGFVRQSGGFVVLDSAPGEGATVTLCLPTATP